MVYKTLIKENYLRKSTKKKLREEKEIKHLNKILLYNYIIKMHTIGMYIKYR